MNATRKFLWRLGVLLSPSSLQSCTVYGRHITQRTPYAISLPMANRSQSTSVMMTNVKRAYTVLKACPGI